MPSTNYTITYLESNLQSFWWFRRAKKIKCEKCNDNFAMLKITNNENPDNEVNVCTECYNSNSTEALLVSRFEVG
ncbi:MAG: hypothetical protein INQ03_17770 [Candidatus Heimdallarchaeota archaeon]|nr:hypothetical protein [Candidatus Heimdallarchaeota archaeon]